MARYQLIFRSRGIDRAALIDSPSSEVEYAGRPLQQGATFERDGETWLVVEESDNAGIPRFICTLTRPTRLPRSG